MLLHLHALPRGSRNNSWLIPRGDGEVVAGDASRCYCLCWCCWCSFLVPVMSPTLRNNTHLKDWVFSTHQRLDTTKHLSWRYGAIVFFFQWFPLRRGRIDATARRHVRFGILRADFHTGDVVMQVISIISNNLYKSSTHVRHLRIENWGSVLHERYPIIIPNTFQRARFQLLTVLSAQFCLVKPCGKHPSFCYIV